MGLSSLSQAFLASIDADAKIRQAAELHLKSYTFNPDTPFACLTLAVSPESHPVVQQSAAVFLKNLVLKYWKTSISKIETGSSQVRSNGSSASNETLQNATVTATNLDNSFGITSPGMTSNSSTLLNSINPQSISGNSFLHSPSSAFNQPLSPANSNKNAIIKKAEQSPFTTFTIAQVAEFKQQVLFSFRMASPIVLNYLANIVAIFLDTSGVPQWPELLPTTIKMLNDPDPNVIFSGVLVCLEAVRYTNTLPFQSQWGIQLKVEVVSLLFPHLFKIAHSLSSETNSRAGLMLWKIIKCYRLAARYDFPEYLQQENQLNEWLGLFLHILSTSYSATSRNSSATNGPEISNSPSLSTASTASFSSSLSHVTNDTSPSSQDSFNDIANKPLDYTLRSSVNPWEKCKKWSCMILSHLMITYTSQDKHGPIRAQVRDYKRFSAIYLQFFAPEIARVLISDVEKWKFSPNSQINSTRDNQFDEILLSSSPAAICSIIDFFESAITLDSLWAQILPKMEIIMTRLIFGTLIYTEADLETFYYNSEEYILTNIENLDFSTRGKALKFLTLLVEKRQDDMFQGILIFINQCFSKYHENPQSLQLCLEKDAALQIMIELEDKVTSRTSPIASQINTFIIEQVIGDYQLSSTAPQNVLLLSRSCEVIAKFESVQFSKAEQERILNHVMQCFNSNTSVMVQYNGAFALRALFMTYQHVCNILSPQISQVMQKMLELYEEVNSESLASVMEDLIDMFTVQLAPFSEQLCSQLSTQLLRILTEISDRENRAEASDADEFSYVDDRQMVAIGILNALNTLLLALEKSPTHISRLEPYLLPVFKAVIENSNDKFYQEVFELIDTCLFTPRCITPNMAHVVSMMNIGFQRDPSQCCEYYGPVLCNFFNFSFPNGHKQVFTSTQQQLQDNVNDNGGTIFGKLGPGPTEILNQYPVGLTEISFQLAFHFLADSDSKQVIQSEDKKIASTLAQTMFLTSASNGIIIDTGPNHKSLIELVYRSLTSLGRAMSSIITYRALIEVILAAAVYDARIVANFLIDCNCFDWVIEITAMRADLFNRAYDNALAALALLNIAVACSERNDGYREMFPKIIRPVLQFVSNYYKAIQNQDIQRRNSQILDLPQQNIGFVYENPSSDQPQQENGGFTFVNESANLSNDTRNDYYVSLQESLVAEPALDNALANFNVYRIYQETIHYLTAPLASRTAGTSNLSTIPTPGTPSHSPVSNVASINDLNSSTTFPASAPTSPSNKSHINNAALIMYYNNSLNQALKDQELLNLHTSIMSLSTL